MSCAEAERMVLDMVTRHTSSGQCPLAGERVLMITVARCLCDVITSGNTVSQDRRFIDKYMPDLGAWLHYRTVDVSTIKELTRRWYPQVVVSFVL